MVLALSLGAPGLILSLSLPSLAQVGQLPTQTVTISGTIESINNSRHTINIRKADGKIETINVPVNVKQFDQFKVGDKVSATYNNAVSAKLKPPGEAPVDKYGSGPLPWGRTWIGRYGGHAENHDCDRHRCRQDRAIDQRRWSKRTGNTAGVSRIRQLLG